MRRPFAWVKAGLMRVAPQRVSRLALLDTRSRAGSPISPSPTVRVSPDAHFRQNRAVAARRDMRALLPAIAAPTAVIVGREDRLTPLALSQEIHALTPGSTLHVIPDCRRLRRSKSLTSWPLC